jgi:hypothetical protein
MKIITDFFESFEMNQLNLFGKIVFFPALLFVYCIELLMDATDPIFNFIFFKKDI